MSVPPLIHVRGVSKRYRVAVNDAATNSLREAMVEGARARLRNLSGARARAERREAETFWALRDVGFEVARGEILGVIGRNGAGKSTLLKVLSRVTAPTSGRIELRGRMASLLEVGTGMHMELTGRENIYMNGTILGMRKREIDRKFDEIVAFAGVERFLDTPVKRYSSGMYVRLAFGVAAHLEPEILVVDEVLAVGDAEFQSKCLGKMSDVASEGRTVLFVSHNMAAMRGLCTRGLLLERGSVVFDGSVETAVRRYLASAAAPQSRPEKGEWIRKGAYRPTKVAVEAVQLLVGGQEAATVQAGDECTFRVHYRALGPQYVGAQFAPQIRLIADGQKIAVVWPKLDNGRGLPVAAVGALDCTIPRWPFRTLNMSADVVTWVGLDVQEHIVDALTFTSHDGDYFGSGVVPYAEDAVVFLDQKWSHVSLPAA